MKKENEKVKVSRRNFLKGTLGAGAILAAGATFNRNKAFAETIGSDIETEEKTSVEQTVKDGINRRVSIPEHIQSVVPSGHYAEAIIMTLCPGKLASIVDEVEKEELAQYKDAGKAEICSLPETGEMYPTEMKDTENNLSVRKVSRVDPDLLLDIGTKKDDLKMDMEYMQRNTGIPTVFIDGSFGKLADVYRETGELLDCNARGEKLARYIENAYDEIKSRRSKIQDTKNIYFARNDNGKCRKTNYSFQNKVIEFLGGTPVDLTTEGPDGNIKESMLRGVDMDCVIFNDWDYYKDIVEYRTEEAKVWMRSGAMQECLMAASPGLFHSWFGFPVFAQIIGMFWLGKLVWPEIYNYDLKEKAVEFYKVFYDYELSYEELNNMI